ncbi:uncharacterized protein LOC142588054 isoform X2 [Dermacentor variabilis]|uniref:uncharacterized protein LOC142588054 isoform X2 n=1 Tax=Dermacentor variabilis TaxID=34621 RepID=UPI003F5B7CE0
MRFLSLTSTSNAKRRLTPGLTDLLLNLEAEIDPTVGEVTHPRFKVILRLLLDQASEFDPKSRFVATDVLTLKLASDRPFPNPRVQLPFFSSPVESKSLESVHIYGNARLQAE